MACLDRGDVLEPRRRVVGRCGVDRLDRDQGGERQSERVVVHDDGVALDDPALLEATHALVHRGCREPRRLSEVGVGHATIAREQSDDRPIQVLHRAVPLSNPSRRRTT